MASALTTFELKGNKKSFANWVSMLSPCETPFVSMVGKQEIDQTQYSWQVDSLAAPDTTPVIEGSDFEHDYRLDHETAIHTNFTQIFRKVVSISDTTKAVGLYGRGSELEYQLEKASKELKRDVEHCLLSNEEGFLGDNGFPAMCGGFEFLCVPPGKVDLDTGAVTHKEVKFDSASGDWFKMANVFDLTAELFIAGAKPDKIMFHPKHMKTFSHLLEYNEDFPLVTRMFDGLDTKYNEFVHIIRDPLGRNYTLLPNRFMPEDKVFIFNTDDWTKVVLRPPVATRLAKTGSNEKWMVEAEVGLRHRNPHASGVLTLTDSDVSNSFITSRTVFTSSIDDRVAVRSETSVSGTPEADVDVFFRSSNPSVISFENDVVKTTSSGRAANRMIAGDRPGIADVWTVFKGVHSRKTQVSVDNPTIELTANNVSPVAGQTVTFTATVKDASGSVVGDGITVSFIANPGMNIEMNSIQADTAKGIATVTGRALNDEETLMLASVKGIKSAGLVLNYKPAPALLEAPTVVTQPLPIGGLSQGRVLMKDERGMALVGETITWRVSPSKAVALSNPTSVTDQNGLAVVDLNGIGRGVGIFSYGCQNKDSETTQFLIGHGATLEFSHTPTRPAVNENVKFVAKVTRTSDGAAIKDAVVRLTSDPAAATFPTSITTNAAGLAEFTTSFSSNSDFEIDATVEAFSVGFKNTVEVQLPDTSFDTPYIHTSSGHNVKLTHDTNITTPITVKSMLWGSPALGIRMDVRSLDPHIAIATAQDSPTNNKGEYTFHVKGMGNGTARFQVKARNNTGSWHDFSVEVGSPTLEVIVSPTTMSAGTAVEFAAVYKDCNGGWVPGVKIRWEHPLTMLAGREQIPESTTDQFGRTFFASRGGAWATHTFRAILSSNPVVRSRDRSITVHM